MLADAARWCEWAGPLVRRSLLEQPGTPAPNGVGAIRKMGSSPVWTREQIVAYDPPEHLAYVLLSGMPIAHYRSDVHLLADGGGGTTVTWRSTFDPRVPGTGAALRWFLRRTVAGFARRLAERAAAPG